MSHSIKSCDAWDPINRKCELASPGMCNSNPCQLWMEFTHAGAKGARDAVQRIWPERGSTAEGNPTVWGGPPIGEEVSRIKPHLTVAKYFVYKLGGQRFSCNHVAAHTDRTAPYGRKQPVHVTVHAAQDMFRAYASSRSFYEVTAKHSLNTDRGSLCTYVDPRLRCSNRHCCLQPCRLYATPFVNSQATSERSARSD
jgi:hypothetical protein